MGTINYNTSDYITMGFNCRNIDYESGEDYIIEEIFDAIAANLRNEYFYFFHVTINPGYYEGFYINIEKNFWFYDNYIEKREALKEVTRIKEFLQQCARHYGLCAVSPGWSTRYYSDAETETKIKEAVKEMRDEIRTAPTWATLPAGEKYA